MCKSNDYSLDEEVKAKIHAYFEEQTSLKDRNFANGRLARNIYDDLVMNHAKRVIKLTNPSKDELSLIRAEDFDKNNASLHR